jgi:limonene-1,2-epoxide hydrolase
MPHALLPAPAPDDLGRLTDPQAVVEAFLAALAAGDAATARALIADDILYVNVGLPPVRGRKEMERVFALLGRPGAGFEVYLHAVATDGPVVLTERTDVLLMGPVEAQFWVWGRFEVHDGRITLWRDSFDYLDILRGTVRGIAALLVPSLRPVRPAQPQVPPGR